MARGSRLDLKKLDQVIRQSPYTVREVLLGAAVEMLGDIVLSFGSSPPGRSYTRGGVTHVASQPGYPPNPDTAALMGSLHIETDGDTVIIADGVEYGVHQELGTETIEPRPFMAPVFEAWRAGKFARYMIAQEIVKA